jgi:thiosulfate reductase cytochrome b subunit
MPTPSNPDTLIYRQSGWTRLTHWIWAVALFFLLLTGLQIFNAHPALYIGKQSGFTFDNSILQIGTIHGDSGPRGVTDIFGKRFDTTGVLGLSESGGQLRGRAFPAWATIPSHQDLGTGRVIHFFFAWVLVGTLLAWLIASAANGHLRRDLVPGVDDIKKLPSDIAAHARLKFHHTRDYNTLQKLAYGGVLFILLPLMILTGLAMSPAVDAWLPLVDLFGGRQTARTIHFIVMLLLVGFFVVHMLMILAAGPFNELRSILTGWYRTDPPHRGEPEASA